MMKKGLLIILPQSDDITEYLTIFSKPIIDECKKVGLRINEIRRNSVTMQNVERDIKSYDYNLIVFNSEKK